MKKAAIILTTFLLISNVFISSATTNWMTSFEDAKKVSLALNKPILVDFWAIWCGPCKKMDTDVWNKEDTGVLIQNFVPLKIDIDTHSNLARKYGVKAIPNILILDGYGKVLYTSIGYKDKSQMQKILKNFTVSLVGVHSAKAILEKDETNIYSNLRVAQKFHDIAFTQIGESKKIFLGKSNSFLKKTKKLIPKDKNVLVEKIELLQLLNKVCAKGYKSALKSLDKNFKTVDESNLALFEFIKFYSFKLAEEKEKSEEAYSKIVKLESNIYLKKADYILKNDQS